MKKILISILCVALATVTLVSCSSKKFDPNSNVTNVDTLMPQTTPVEEFEIPEEEQVFSVEFSMETIDRTLKITAYEGQAKELVIPSQLTHPTAGVLPVSEIGDAAFLGNETLVSVVIPEGVNKIGSGAFESCTALTKVTLPEGFTTIGENAFYNSALAEINIPNSVTSIGYHAFSSQLNETPWYASLTGEKVIVGDGILLKCNVSNKIDVSKPETVVADSGEESTEDVTEATDETALVYVEVDITDVKHIAYDAFTNPGAISIKIGDALESIDKYAIFVPSGTTNVAKFLVPNDPAAEAIVKASGYDYELYGDSELND